MFTTTTSQETTSQDPTSQGLNLLLIKVTAIVLISIIIFTIICITFIIALTITLHRKEIKRLKAIRNKENKHAHSLTVDEGTGQVMNVMRQEEGENDVEISLQTQDMRHSTNETASIGNSNKKLVREASHKVKSSSPPLDSEHSSSGDNKCLTDIYATANKSRKNENVINEIQEQSLPEYAVVKKGMENEENLVKDYSLSVEDLYTAVEKSIPPIGPMKTEDLLNDLNFQQ